jgi:hypothetical protein
MPVGSSRASGIRPQAINSSVPDVTGPGGEVNSALGPSISVRRDRGEPGEPAQQANNKQPHGEEDDRRQPGH